MFNWIYNYRLICLQEQIEKLEAAQCDARKLRCEAKITHRVLHPRKRFQPQNVFGV